MRLVKAEAGGRVRLCGNNARQPFTSLQVCRASRGQEGAGRNFGEAGRVMIIFAGACLTARHRWFAAGNAILLNGIFRRANREIGVPGGGDGKMGAVHGQISGLIAKRAFTGF